MKHQVQIGGLRHVQNNVQTTRIKVSKKVVITFVGCYWCFRTMQSTSMFFFGGEKFGACGQDKVERGRKERERERERE